MTANGATRLSCEVRAWLNLFDFDRSAIQVYQNGREWVPIGDELPLCFVALVRDHCLRWTGDDQRLTLELCLHTTEAEDQATVDSVVQSLQEDYPE